MLTLCPYIDVPMTCLPVVRAGGAAGVDGGADAPAPVRQCLCGIDCPRKVSQSEANNGRAFYACTKMRDVSDGQAHTHTYTHF